MDNHSDSDSDADFMPDDPIEQNLKRMDRQAAREAAAAAAAKKASVLRAGLYANHTEERLPQLTRRNVAAAAAATTIDSESVSSDLVAAGGAPDPNAPHVFHTITVSDPTRWRDVMLGAAMSGLLMTYALLIYILTRVH